MTYHLLERQTLGLGHQEPDEGRTQVGQQTEENVRAIGNALEHVGCDLADDEVVHPVAGSAEGDTVRPGAEGPDLGDDDPRARAPRVTKVDDKEPDHADSRPAGRPVLGPLVDVLGHQHGNDDVAGGHADGADGQHGLAAGAVDPEHGRDSGDEHDDADDTRGQERCRVEVEAELLENEGSVIQNRVDTRPLC